MYSTTMFLFIFAEAERDYENMRLESSKYFTTC